MNTPEPGIPASIDPYASRRGAGQTLRCERCGEVIGVNEPLVRLLDGRVYESSRALEPACSDRGGEHYHRACYAPVGEGRPLVG